MFESFYWIDIIVGTTGPTEPSVRILHLFSFMFQLCIK